MNNVNIKEEEQRLESNKNEKIIVYTAPSCSNCIALIDYLSGREIDFIEKDVTKDRSAAIEMIRRSGQKRVPQTLIGGEIVIGYSKFKIEDLLKLKRTTKIYNSQTNEKIN